MTLVNELAIRRQLETLQTELRGRLGLSSDETPTGAPSNTPNPALTHHALTMLEQVEDALLQLKRGQYGVCRSCGTVIRAERLEALPYATLCVKCSARAA